MQAHVRTLFGSGLLRIVDWRCNGHAPEPFGGEEWNDAHEVVVVRRGGFVRRAGGHDVFLDPGTVAFTHAHESYQVRHPLPGGDACSAFRLAPAAAAELMADGESGGEEREQVRFPALSAPLDGRSVSAAPTRPAGSVEPGRDSARGRGARGWLPDVRPLPPQDILGPPAVGMKRSGGSRRTRTAWRWCERWSPAATGSP